MILCQAFGPSFFKDFPLALIWSFSFLHLFLIHVFFDILFSDYFMKQLGRTWVDSALVLPVLTVKFH